MNDRLFGSVGFARADARVLIATVPVAVYDRGASTASGERFEAELASYPVVCEVGGSPWEAVSRLVSGHRALLERRWAPGGPSA
jgi:hypothetical protein